MRRRPDETAAFLELGEALRQAHGELDARRTRELSGQQWRIISALSQQAVWLAAEAGHRIGQSVQRELETTLRAAVADPEAAQEWANGTLTAPLTPPSTFAPAGGARTAAAPAAAPSPGRGPEHPGKGKDRDELA
ncbi:hypothetical protein [Actinacidiphila acididurans]|uniref:Uncharacterized protein n=1 Tax=Actinacidiphila acididurans TaxID=2784346 RepID=A0ABS2TXG2_9ACTN|nr:hypothetical protein [Actinacidiphila acididurans]MBM9508024.1 hypothetical protein [Actinacidiphila acididurans]